MVSQNRVQTRKHTQRKETQSKGVASKQKNLFKIWVPNWRSNPEKDPWVHGGFCKPQHIISSEILNDQLGPEISFKLRISSLK